MLKYLNVAVGCKNTHQRMLWKSGENAGKNQQKTICFRTDSSKISIFQKRSHGVSKSRIRETRNRKESYVQICFKSQLIKIKEDPKKDHKSPDFLCVDIKFNKSVATIEVYGSEVGNIEHRCKKAIEHGDSKEIGLAHYSKKYKLDNDIIKIAALVVDDDRNIILMNEDDLLRTVKKSIPEHTKMDLFLLLLHDCYNSQCRTFLIRLTEETIPDIFSETVMIVE